MCPDEPTTPATSQLPPNPTDKVEAAIMDMLVNATKAMDGDVQALLAKNGASKPPADAGVLALTTNMITLWGDRLKALIQPAKPAAPDKPDET